MTTRAGLVRHEGPPLVHYTIAAGELFEALSIPLLSGRLFDARDDVASVPVAIVSEAFVKRHFPEIDPIGKRVKLADRLSGVSRQIVGVVGDVRRSALHEAPQPGMYLPHAQAPTGANAFIVHGTARPAALLEETKRAIWKLNPAIAIYHETTMADLVGASVRQRRFLLVLLSIFAAMALVLAAAGIFGLMSFIIAQRTREYGVRLALGALRGEVILLVLRRGMTLAAAGIALGVFGALVFTRLLTGMLYDVSPFDPVTFVLAVLVLGFTAAIASLYPATRAAGVNPLDVLRGE